MAHPAQTAAPSMIYTYNERRDIAQGWFEKASGDCDGAQIPYPGHVLRLPFHRLAVAATRPTWTPAGGM